jgi:tape measure domain-containing protein
LLDNANANNQTQEQLIATIDALGAANVRGGVTIKNLVALTQSGVPVFDLLGKAMGISADRVRQLATEGKLGTDSVKLLVTELGKLRAGASAAELGDSDAQITKLRDAVDEFFNTIAHSGALDFFRGELKQLNAEIEEADKSGRLKELAKSISDGIVGTATAIKSAIGFVYDYSGALLELGKTYVLFRSLNFAGSVYQGAASLLSAAKAASTAAAEGGAAVGIFGRLGAAAKAIPSQVKIGILAVGADIALSSFQKITEALKEEAEVLDGTNKVIDDNGSALNRLRARISETKAESAKYADTIILTSNALRGQTQDQLESYKQALEGAQRYYAALAVEAERAGKTLAKNDADAHLAALAKAVAEVNAQLATTSAVGQKAAKGLSDGASKVAADLGEVGNDAKAAGDKIQKAFEGFDLSKPTTEVGDFATGLDAVAAKGGKASEVIDKTLLESLKKLSGKELLNFQSSAIAAIDGLGASAGNTSETLKATLETALDRLGVKAEDTGAKITKSGSDTIATFLAVTENVQASSKTITAAFDAALGGAKTVDEAKALGTALQEAAQAGKVGFQDMAVAGRELDERIRTITASLSPLTSQFELLGIKSQTQLNSTRDNAREAFEAIVAGARNGTAAQEDVVRAFKAYADAARAAAADSNQYTQDQVNEQLAVQASVLGLADALGKAGDAGKKAGSDTSESFDDAKKHIDDAGDAAKRFGDDVGDAADEQRHIGDGAAAAAAAFGGIVALTRDQTEAMKILNAELQRGGSVVNFSLSTAKFILEQIGPLIGGTAQVLERHIEDLQQAADRASESAKRMADEASDIQDQIDGLLGNEVSIENRRHENKLADLKAEAEAAGTQNTAEYKRLVALENELHALKLKNAQEEQRQNGGPKGLPGSGGAQLPSRGGSSPTPPGTPPTPEAPPPPAPTPPPTPQPPPPAHGAAGAAPVYHVTIQAPGLIPMDPVTLDGLARRLEKELARISALRY